MGIVLYELLAGTVPFTAGSAIAMVAARMLRPPPDLQKARPDLPAAAAQVVGRCLLPDPARRFQRASEVAAALSQAAAERAAEPTVSFAAPPSPGPRAVAVALPPPIEAPPVNPHAVAPLPFNKAQRSIAVLPLWNHGPPEDNYLADGLVQELIDTLAALKGLRVYSRSAVARFAAPELDAVAAGRALGVELVLHGTLRRVEGQLRLAVRLVKVADGFQVFAERFDCYPSQVFAVLDTLSASIAEALNLAHAATPRPVAADAKVLESYLRARHLYGLADRASLGESVRLFERVLQQAPNVPNLQMSYALAVARMWFYGDLASGDKARAAAERAVMMMPDRGEPHLAVAAVSFQEADLPAAVQSLATALTLAPELADAQELLGRILIETGPLRDGLQHLVDARALDPALVRTVVDQARLCALMGDFGQAHALLADPEFNGRFSIPWFTRARFCLWERDQRRARAYLGQIEKERTVYPRAWLFLRVAAGAGQVDPQEVLTDGLGSDHSSPRGRIFFHQIHTELFSFWGQREWAVRSLSRSVDAGLTDLTWLDRCPLLLALAGDPRVAALRRVVYARAMAAQAAAAPLLRQKP